MKLNQLLQQNGTFLAKLLTTLTVQALITFGVMEFCRSRNITLGILPLILCYILLLALLAVIMLASLPIYTKFLIFTLVSIIIGATLSTNNVSDATIKRAIWGAVGIFIAMFLVGVCLTGMGVDLSVIGIILLILLVSLIIGQLLMYFYPVSDTASKVWIHFGVILFGFYVIYDINIILQYRPFGDDYVASSVNLYFDFINIFISLLKKK
jgi:FtsH-binding integral membrane protein